MLLKLSKMLLMNLTEEKNLTRVILLLPDTALLLFTWFELSITVKTVEQSVKSVQSAINKKITRISIGSYT